MQSNAQHTILANEEVIPNDYLRAQNCIQPKSKNMDSFGTLKSMLMTVHPNLNKTTPPDRAPIYSAHNDLDLYEQALRNYFLLHYLYDGN